MELRVFLVRAALSSFLLAGAVGCRVNGFRLAAASIGSSSSCTSALLRP